VRPARETVAVYHTRGRQESIPPEPIVHCTRRNFSLDSGYGRSIMRAMRKNCATAIETRGSMCFAALAVALFVLIPLLSAGCGQNGIPQKNTGKTPSPPTAEDDADLPVRRAAFTRTHYPGSITEITKTIARYMANARRIQPGGKPLAIIGPHAGAQFSWPLLAKAYLQVKGGKYDTVIMVGLSHRYPIEAKGAAVYGRGFFKTPLGKVKINSKLAQEIIGYSDRITNLPEAHANEHSLEMHLPLLQTVLPKAEIVPILINNRSFKDCELLAAAIAAAAKGKNVLIAGSTDLSHYPNYKDALAADREMVASWKTLDAETVWNKELEICRRRIHGLSCAMCSRGAVATVLMAAKLLGAKGIHTFGVMNSAELGGRRTGTVGYGAAVIWGSEGK